jgi:DinB superfamily
MVRTTLRLLGAVATLALVVPSARAQYSPDRATALEVRKEFVTELDSLQSKFTQLADAFPDDKYSWRPAPGVRSVGEVFMHVASEYYFYTPAIWGAKPSPLIEPKREAFDKFEKMSTKPEVLQHLKDGFSFGRQAIVSLEDEKLIGIHKIFNRDSQVLQMSVDMTSDLHEHLGQLIAYARMNGIKPPWSK